MPRSIGASGGRTEIGLIWQPEVSSGWGGRFGASAYGDRQAEIRSNARILGSRPPTRTIL